MTENRRRGDEDPDKSLPGRCVKVVRKQCLRKANQGERKTDKGDIHKAPARGQPSKMVSMVWWPGGDWWRVQDSFERRKWRSTGCVSTGQLAKLQMLQFYYDCLDHFIDRRDFKLIQMDTDSTYLMQNARRSRLPRGSWRVPSDKNELVNIGQMEQLHTVSVG